tara:strand:+ start:1959 stop:2351 length:393 start_codon:yes stop_codon:yes gene_type:complete
MKKQIQKIGNNYFNPRVFPKNYNIFLFKSFIIWFSINLGVILLYSFIFYFYDNKYESKFNGLDDGKRDYYEYLYMSAMIGTIVGFGDITAKKDPFAKFIIISEVFVSLFCNFAFICFKELKLADDPDETF